MIEFRNVSKMYPNGTKGLNNINLKIQKGEFIVMVGLSGAGKSTLLRSVNRLHEITEGEIIIEGESITSAKGKGLRRMRRDIGMIFQSFNLVKRSTVLKNSISWSCWISFHTTYNVRFVSERRCGARISSIKKSEYFRKSICTC